MLIADGRRENSLEGLSDGRVLISELSEYDVSFRDVTGTGLSFAPPVIVSALAGPNGLGFGRLPRQEGLGVARLALLDHDGLEVWRTLLDIRPGKFREIAEFDAMVADLCDWRTALALDPARTTSADWRLGDPGVVTPEERLVVLRSAMRDLGFFDDLSRVEREAVRQLKRDETPIRVGRDPFDPRQFGRALNIGGTRLAVPSTHPLSARLASLPAEAPAARKSESLDTPENRFVRFAVENLQDALASALASWRALADTPLRRWAVEAERRLGAARRSAFLGQIPRTLHVHTGSPGLQRRQGYAGVLRAWLHSRAGLSLRWDELSERVFAETRDVPTLYEFWCLLKMREILQDQLGARFGLEPFVIEGRGVRLRRGGAALSSDAIVVDGRSWTLRLSYNRAFSPTERQRIDGLDLHAPGVGTWSKIMKPDLTLGLWPWDTKEEDAARDGSLRLLHFDAKYRLRALAGERDGERGFKPDDLDKMHAYAAGIQHSVGAYVLYPGDEDRRFALRERPGLGVGALGLVPGSDLSMPGRNVAAIVRAALS
jgi:hypothetical protein